MATIYNKETDALLFEKRGGRRNLLNQDERENIYLDSLLDGNTIFSLINKNNRGGVAILRILDPQYETYPTRRKFKQAEVHALLNDLQTKSIKTICDTYKVTPNMIAGILVRQRLRKEEGWGWSKEEDDYLYSCAQEVYAQQEQAGKAHVIHQKDMESIVKKINEAFPRKNRSFGATRSRLHYLNQTRTSLGYLIREDREPKHNTRPTRTPSLPLGKSTNPINPKEFKAWVMTRGVELYIQEKTSELRKALRKGL